MRGKSFKFVKKVETDEVGTGITLLLVTLAAPLSLRYFTNAGFLETMIILWFVLSCSTVSILIDPKFSPRMSS